MLYGPVGLSMQWIPSGRASGGGLGEGCLDLFALVVSPATEQAAVNGWMDVNLNTSLFLK